MQPITVAIADTDTERRTRFEHSLRNEQGITVLANITSSAGDMTINRRLKSRAGICAMEDTVARVRRLNPRVLLASLSQCLDADCAMLVALRHECPDTRVVLLAEKDIQEGEVVRALASGARGCLSRELEASLVAKAVKVIDQGEAWVPRKMLGKIMDEVLHWHVSSSEVPS